MKILKERLQELPATIALGARLELELVEHYDRAIDEIDRKMAELAYTDENIQLLMSVAGISYYSGFVMMSEIGDVNRFASAKQLTSYAGLCPRVSQSGLSAPRLGSITKKGRSRLRWICVECAHVAVRYNPKLQRLKWRVQKRSGNANKAIVASARKLLELCYYILKSGTPYSEAVAEKYDGKLRKLRGKAKKRKAS
jgi:transposase